MPVREPSAYRSFPMFLHDLILTHGQGKIARVADAAKIRPEVMRRWLRGMEVPLPVAVHRLTHRYGFDFPAVYGLCVMDWDRKLRGVKIPLPDLSNVQRGPASRADVTLRTKSS